MHCGHLGTAKGPQRPLMRSSGDRQVQFKQIRICLLYSSISDFVTSFPQKVIFYKVVASSIIFALAGHMTCFDTSNSVHRPILHICLTFLIWHNYVVLVPEIVQFLKNAIVTYIKYTKLVIDHKTIQILHLRKKRGSKSMLYHTFHCHITPPKQFLAHP